MGFWLEHTGFDDGIVEAYRMAEIKAGPFATARAESDTTPKPKRPWFTEVEIEAIYARWNAPRRPAPHTED